MSNETDYHMTPFKEGEFNPVVIVVFIIIVVLIIGIWYLYEKYLKW